MADERRAISGARGAVYVNNTRIAWATGIDINETHQNIRVDTLGNIYTEEIEPVGIAVNLSIATVRIFRESLQRAGIIPGGDTKNVISFPSATIQVIDSVTNEALGVVRGVRLSGRAISLQSRSIMMSNLNYEGLQFEEFDPSS